MFLPSFSNQNQFGNKKGSLYPIYEQLDCQRTLYVKRKGEIE